jgi:hypothetical protein
MNCNVGWDPEFMDSILAKNFRTSALKAHREQVLFEREKIMLPDTIPLVEVVIEKRKKEAVIIDLFSKKQLLLLEVEKLNTEMYDIRRYIDNLNIEKFKKKEFIKACPATACRGFLSTTWVCGICETKACNKCHEIVVEGHKCNPEIIESIKMMAKDTKPCPTCATNIFKIDGCDQVWCWECKTAFGFKSGKIDKGPIHSPDYYEWMRRQNGGVIPRVLGDVPCGNVIPHMWDVSEYLNKNKIKFNFHDYHRAIVHVQHVEIPKNRPKHENNSDLRVLFLLNEIDEDAFKKEVYKRETKNIKSRVYRQVFEMLRDVGTDFLNKIMTIKTAKDADKLKNEFNELRLYFNECMRKTCISYSVNVRQLDEKWNI